MDGPKRQHSPYDQRATLMRASMAYMPAIADAVIHTFVVKYLLYLRQLPSWLMKFACSIISADKPAVKTRLPPQQAP